MFLCYSYFVTDNLPIRHMFYSHFSSKMLIIIPTFCRYIVKYLRNQSTLVASLFKRFSNNFTNMLQTALVAFHTVNICHTPGLYILLRQRRLLRWYSIAVSYKKNKAPPHSIRAHFTNIAS